MDCTILVKKRCGPLFIVHWHFLCSIMREKIGEVFSFLGKSAFFSKIGVFNNVWRPEKGSYCYQSNCQTILSAPIIVSWRLSHSTLWENIRQTHFFTWKLPFFPKIVFSTTFFVLNSYYFHTSCQNIFSDLITRFLRFLHSTIRKRTRQIHFFTEKVAFFQKNMCFKQPLRSQRNDPIFWTIIAKIPCGA